MKRRKGCRMRCDVGKASEALENELRRRWSDVSVGASFSNPFVASPTSQLILQPFSCFTYVIGTSPTSPGEPPMPLWWYLINPWWFCNLLWLRPSGLNERCKLALELKRLKTPDLGATSILLHNNIVQKYCPSRGRFRKNESWNFRCHFVGNVRHEGLLFIKAYAFNLQTSYPI